MLSKILRKLRFLQTVAGMGGNHGRQADAEQFSPSLRHNLEQLQRFLGESSDVVVRRLSPAPACPQAAVAYIDGLVDKADLNQHILRPLMLHARRAVPAEASPDGALKALEERLVSIGELKTVKSFGEAMDAMVSGDTCLLLDGADRALILNTRGWKARGVEEPQSEASVRGPREGFTETLRVNTALLRRRIKSPALTFDTLRLGRRTKTDVCVVYLRGITRDELVSEVKRRLRRIDVDAILDSGYIEQFIEDAPLSPFSTVANSERTDTVAAKIMEGRVGILVDGSPIVLTVPMFFVESFQTPDDYYARPFFVTITRWIRYGAFTISILAPGIYVALTAFHQELLPTPLAISVAASREGVPFPAILEALGMGLVFEALREAGIRIPRPFGQAISIVGALVVGEAAVRAGLVGAPMIIVVALTAIASFVVPPQQDVGTILRVGLTILAGILGAPGLAFGLLLTLVHLAALRSFGAPYLAPLAPFKAADLKDVAVRAPWWFMLSRPSFIRQLDPERQRFRLPAAVDEDGQAEK